MHVHDEPGARPGPGGARPGHRPHGSLASNDAIPPWRGGVAGARRARRALPAAGVALLGLAYGAALSPWFFTSRSVTDVGIQVMGGVRILQGQVPFRDFFLFVGPLGPYLTGAWFWLVGGSGALQILALMALTCALLALATYALAVRWGGPRLAALAAGVVLATGPAYWYAISHHWYATFVLVLATLAAARAVRGGGPRWLVLAGVCTSLGIFAHPARGIVFGVGLAIATVIAAPRVSRGRGLLLLATSSLAVGDIGVAALTAAGAGPAEVLYGMAGFALSDYPGANQVPYLAFDLVPVGSVRWTGWGVVQAAAAWPLLAVAPVAPLALLAIAYRHRAGWTVEDRATVLLAASSLFAWIGILYQPSAVHVGYVMPWLATCGVALARRLTVPDGTVAGTRRDGYFASLSTTGRRSERGGPPVQPGGDAPPVVPRGWMRRQRSLKQPLADVRRRVRGGALKPQRVAVVALGLLLAPALPVPQVLAVLRGEVVWANAPTGPVPLGAEDVELLSGSFVDVARVVEARTLPGSPVVFYPYRSVNGALLARTNPLRLDLIYAGENPRSQIEAAVDSLVNGRVARLVVIEKGPAERQANQAGAPEASRDGAEALAALRTLPLVAETPYVEIRAPAER